MTPPETGFVWMSLWICAAVTLIVFAVMLYSIATFHGPHGMRGYHRRVLPEIAWAIVPIAIITALAAPAVRTLLPG